MRSDRLRHMRLNLMQSATPGPLQWADFRGLVRKARDLAKARGDVGPN